MPLPDQGDDGYGPMKCIHGLGLRYRCPECENGPKPLEEFKDAKLNELISNMLHAQSVMMSIISELMLKVRNLEYAVKERQIAENHFGKRKDGDESRQAAEAGSSDSIEQSEREAEEEVTGLMFRFRVSYKEGETYVIARNEQQLKERMLQEFGVDDYMILDKQ